MQDNTVDHVQIEALVKSRQEHYQKIIDLFYCIFEVYLGFPCFIKFQTTHEFMIDKTDLNLHVTNKGRSTGLGQLIIGLVRDTLKDAVVDNIDTTVTFAAYEDLEGKVTYAIRHEPAGNAEATFHFATGAESVVIAGMFDGVKQYIDLNQKVLSARMIATLVPVVAPTEDTAEPEAPGA